MVEFLLNRETSTPFYTLGVLTEKESGFKCRTLERPLASWYKNPRLPFVAIAAGVYKMKLVAEEVNFTFGFRFHGSYRDARFEAQKRAKDARAGSICIGKSFVKGVGLMGSEEVYKILNHLIDKMIDEGSVNPTGRNNEIIITIKEDEMVREEQAVQLGEEKWKPKDYNCLEEESPLQLPQGGESAMRDVSMYDLTMDEEEWEE